MHGENGHELLTDLYQLTMAQGYWETGQGATQACFHAYFRDYPFRGGYAIACGMDQLAELIDGFAFSAEDVDYLASLDAPGGGRLFKPAFLEYLRTFSLRVDVDAVAEGAVVFPHEPLVRVMGPIMDCQLIETALLNCVNFETLIATKAARVCLAAHGAARRRVRPATRPGRWRRHVGKPGCRGGRLRVHIQRACGQNLRPAGVGHACAFVGHVVSQRARGLSRLRARVPAQLRAARGHLRRGAGHPQRHHGGS